MRKRVHPIFRADPLTRYIKEEHKECRANMCWK